ncbi:MAG: hypothetical protein IPL46_25655 [Saprospiraceae bacterium]|nr:hypothetical protein [Saprospiraceae bacterium]
MRYKVGDRVVLKRDISDHHRDVTIPEGSKGTVATVMELFKSYWVNFDDFPKTYVRDVDLE